MPECDVFISYRIERVNFNDNTDHWASFALGHLSVHRVLREYRSCVSANNFLVLLTISFAKVFAFFMCV